MSVPNAGMIPDKKPLPRLTQLDHIADRLRVTRQALDLRPIDVCRRTGILPNAYSQYESAKNRPNLDDMIRYCEAFDVTLDWIYRGDPGALPYDLARKVLKLDEVGHAREA